MVQLITASDLKNMLDTQVTCALIDVREPGEYNASHIAGASLVPRRQLEFRMHRLVHHKKTLMVVCDDDCQRAPLAADTLEQMGYTQVRMLAGGLNRWTTEGYATEWGVNVPSKDFGEKMEVQHHIPVMHPEELQDRLQRGDKIVILDSRTPEEHQRVTIPQARSAPNGELALRISAFAPDPETTVVVHCAGRTRSIIGARLLQRMGMSNVYDLRNGTMGWQMAGLELEYGSSRSDLPEPTPEGRHAAEAFASQLATEDGVQYLTIEALQTLITRSEQENVYLIDVRTEAEYANGHIPAFQWSPGGQAVQRADDLVAVRNGQIVFACDGRVRATVAASWYRQMGFPNVYAVDGGINAWTASGLSLEQSTTNETAGGYDEGLISNDLPFGYETAKRKVDTITPQALQHLLSDPEPPVVIFVDTSQDFSRGHVPGAHWIPRGWLEFRVTGVVTAKATPVVVTCTDGLNAVLAGGVLKETGYQQVTVLEGGMAAWQQAGLAVEQGLSGVMSPPHDVLPMGIDRNWADAMHYLRWEEALGKKYAAPHA
ncbi:MAG: rhodanese-like domain-containing protein [bacterium]|nr:rhodanese-like domain-containing protein [bacterium]